MSGGVFLQRLGPFVHRLCHPFASQVEKLIAKLSILRQVSKPHALARRSLHIRGRLS
jgi:hypothetical protein